MLCSIIGATAMFLRFNFYLQNLSGGFRRLVIGVLFCLGLCIGVQPTVSVIVLVFIFAVPLMDMVLSVIRRLLKRRNIFYPDLSISIINWWAEGYPSQSQPLFYMPLPSFLVVAIIVKLPRVLDILIGAVLFFDPCLFSVLQLSKNKLKT